eukprot:Hpha_TRINITY_DN26070_c0_g1::TRINITY_DN26070_c0_g1_i1::g.115228::m.115228
MKGGTDSAAGIFCMPGTAGIWSVPQQAGDGTQVLQAGPQGTPVVQAGAQAPVLLLPSNVPGQVVSPSIVAPMLMYPQQPQQLTSLQLQFQQLQLQVQQLQMQGAGAAQSFPAAVNNGGVFLQMQPQVLVQQEVRVQKSRPEGGRVLLLKDVGVMADVKELIRIVEERISPAVVEQVLEVWTKGVFLMRTDLLVPQPEVAVLPGTRGATFEVAHQQTLSIQPSCTLLNAKFFIAHPLLDTTGTSEELKAYEELAATWRDRPSQRPHLSERIAQAMRFANALEGLSEVPWEEMLLPHYPRHFSAHHPRTRRRMYTQLVFKYKSIADATKALKQGSGRTFKDGPFTTVVRLDYGDPGAIASAPRVSRAETAHHRKIPQPLARGGAWEDAERD